MVLLDLIKDKYKIISLVGMAKNCGKTTTLNQLLMEAEEEDLRVGITSIGRDGENQDMVTYTEKPLIYVQEGTLIATAEETLKLSKAKMEILEITEIRTSLGPVILSRVLKDGYVQIAGPNTNNEINLISEKMLSLGAGLIVVDGAIDRVSSASPITTEGTILATGAVLNRDMTKVIAETAYKINLFNIEEIQDPKMRSVAKDALKNHKITIVDKDYAIKALSLKTSLNVGSKIAKNIEENSRYVSIKGALVSKTIKDIINYTRLYKNIIFIVEDATKIFINQRDWQYFQRIGIRINVVEAIDVLAVTLNPYSPRGYYFDPDNFLKNMQKVINKVPVIDVMLSG